ncbi:hypothetical protein ES695_15860 [Candidatus Atribacteria bacterium 1244-E10-H5-B2]|nr:MAG: hypothetical protein ES695_15860 [Candidatus Atribacteria bacterium 1244-E10-H5-B2]
MIPQKVKIEELERTKSFYDKKLKNKKLTEKQRNSFLWALESINRIIEREKYIENDIKKGSK